MKGISIGGQKDTQGVELNMSPLIDMVFILLIFFLVATSFVKESGGPEIKRPYAATAEQKEKTNIIVSVTQDGVVYIEGQAVDMRSVRTQMERFYNENPMGNVVITADANAKFEVPLEVLDKVREAGISNVVVAASKEE
jgi:biopolymer transport protein ExbD